MSERKKYDKAFKEQVVLPILSGETTVSRMKTELVSAALKQAVGRTGASKGLLVHSDRGIQYASNDYQKLPKKHGLSAR